MTVGSMGHSSSIALGIAMQKKDKRIWILDGDGAMLMHMGSMAVIGANKLNNIVHVLLNNEAHESVGGMPTVSNSVDYCNIAKACHYERVYCVDNLEDLEKVLSIIVKDIKLTFLEIKVAIGSRKDLGRPTLTPLENKKIFMHYLN